MDEPGHDVVVVPFSGDDGSPRPPEFDRAPPWAWMLYEQQRRLQFQVRDMQQKLGNEPDSDGKGGKGLIGDLRKATRDLAQLMDLRSKGIGAFAALALFGAVILLGVIHFIQNIGLVGK